MKAYLAGAIEHAPDNGKGWRREITHLLKAQLGHTVYDPTVEEHQILDTGESDGFRDLKSADPERFKQTVRKLIDHDLQVLTSESDYVICLWDEYVKHGAGTQGEVTVAYHNEIPIYLVSDLPEYQISGWILGCSSAYFTTFDELVDFLAEKYPRKG